ncbi:hypothetical protein [Paraburkholderia strydomiana]|uniref:hypothetical protein n=1 Tax=Paraburkholderia strydomiana TaxID=1245417 RepID=UPI0038BA3458
MFKNTINLFTYTACILLLAACVSPSNNTSKIVFSPIKRSIGKDIKCSFELKPHDITRPTRGIIEGNSSFLDPSWELYVIDVDTKKLSKTESVWTFEAGKIIKKPNKTEAIDLNLSELQAIVALANSVWASPKGNPSEFAPDVAWHIDLVDGSEKRCESGLGKSAGNGGLLTNTIYAIWKSHRKPEQ